MITQEKMNSEELLLIRLALTNLAIETLQNGDEFNDFETIAKLERNFAIAYYSAKGIK